MVDVLSANTPIVTPGLGPTTEFMIKWAQLASTLQTIPALATAAEVSAVLDVIGAAVGDMLVRGSTRWGPLAPGTVGQFLTSQVGGPKWTTAALTTALAALTDVLLAAPANNDVLTYVASAGKWENKPSAGGGGASLAYYLTPPVYASLTGFRNVPAGNVITQRTSGAVPSMVVQSTGGADGNLYTAMNAVPVGTFSVVHKSKTTNYGAITGWHGSGPAVYNSGNGKAESMFLNGGNNLYSIDWASLSGNTVTLGGATLDADFFQHLDYDGTNIIESISRNGVDKAVVRSVTVAGTMGAITHAGPSWSGDGSLLHIIEHFYVGALGTSGVLP